jgi:arylsulfatase A-like enzyme
MVHRSVARQLASSRAPRHARRARRLAVVLLAAVSLPAFLPVVRPIAATPAGAAQAQSQDNAPNDVPPGDDGATTPPGYWLVASDGGLFSFGASAFHGSTGNIKLNQPIVGMAATRIGDGYWLVATDGGIFSFGGAHFYGSTGAVKLNRPIVGMAATPSGGGYWLVASDGGIFSYGDAHFYGSTGAVKLNRPITGMARTPTGTGYWLVATDGGLFSYGDAQFWGSVAGQPGNRNVVSVVSSTTGAGYWEVASDGTVSSFGDAADLGSAHQLTHPVVGAAVFPTGDGLPPDPKALVPTGGSSPPPVGPPGSPPPTLLPNGKGKPNILFILVDDARADGVMDQPLVLPKTKRWLAAGGTTFDQGYATTSLCCPERATIWSGRVEHNNLVTDNYSGDNLDHNWISPRYLQDAGYRTALVGKFITDWNYRYEPPHFDQYAAFQGGYVDQPFMVKDPGMTTHQLTGKSTGYTTDYVAQKATDYINGFARDNPGQPWFMQVAPHAPHNNMEAQKTPGGCDLKTLYTWPSRYDNAPVPPWNPTPAVTVEGDSQFQNKQDKVPYVRNNSFPSACGAVTYEGQMRTLLAVDDMVDQLMTTLQDSGQLSNTLVIFTSDNGFSHGERGLTSKGMPYREHILLPTMVRWDGVFPAGTVDHRAIGGEDFLPTYLDAARYTPPEVHYALDGHSFLPGAPGRSEKYLEFGPVGRPTPPGYKGHRGIPTWASVRTNDYQYIEYYASDNTTVAFQEYYDLGSDPWELKNLVYPASAAAANHIDLAGLSAHLRHLEHCAGTTGADACP